MTGAQAADGPGRDSVGLPCGGAGLIRTSVCFAALLLVLCSAAATSGTAAFDQGPKPRLALVTCRDAGPDVPSPGGVVFGARVGLPSSEMVLDLARSGIAGVPYWRLAPLYVVAGTSAFTIEIAGNRHPRAGMAWNRAGRPAQRARVQPCSYGNGAYTGNWIPYYGGFWVARPTCLALLVVVNGTRYTAHVPLGRACH
jgi:hypothetical protein